MSDSSLTGAIGRAMGEAAHGAVLGHTIVRMKDEIDDTIGLANRWAAYAGGLEREIVLLKSDIKSMELHRREQLEEITGLKLQLVALGEKHQVAQDNREMNNEIAVANQIYGKQIKNRLRQMEKALQHSSADKASMRALLQPYEDLVKRLNLEGELPPDLRLRAETLWNNFNNGDNLTDDPEIQKIIDEAPVPVRVKFSDI